jgi:hypothetical protein
MKIKIEKGVDMPKHRTRSAKYPFSTMEIGDSFFIKSDSPTHERGRISAAATAHAKRHGGRFSTQVFDAGVRTWRVE